MDFLDNIPGWPAYVASLIMLFLLINERWFKVKGDAIAGKKSALELVQLEVKALADLVERKDREHREDLKEKEREWRETMDRKDLEHQAAFKENTLLIKNLEKDLAVYKVENKQKDEKIKELKELISDKTNPRIEELISKNTAALVDIHQFMKIYVGEKKINELPIK